tara:strand:+ start:4273 stop:5994 length:1722 start_codon:yes stop_codon:yes gene_type:complete
MSKSKQKNNLSTRVLKDFLMKHKVLFLIYFIIVLIVLPVELYFLPRYTSGFFSVLYKTSRFQVNSVIPLIATLGGVMIGNAIKDRFEIEIVPSFTIFIRKYVFRGIIEKYQTQFESLPLGKITNVLSEYPFAMSNILMNTIRTFIPFIAGLLFLVGYFFSINRSIGLLQLGVLVFSFLLFYFESNKCRETARAAHEDIIELSESVQDRLSNITSIYVSQQENEEINRHSKFEERNRKLYFINRYCGWKTILELNIGLIVSLCIFSYLTYKLYKSKKITINQVTQMFIAEVYYFISLVRRMQNQASDVVNAYGNVQAIENTLKFNELSFEPKKEVCNESPVINKVDTMNTMNGKDTSTKKEIIVFKNVSFKYPNTDNSVLKNFSTTIYVKERIWLKGHSGCGKSTLLKLLMSALKTNKGSIHIGYDQMNIATTPVSVIRKNMSFIDQNTKLFNDTLFENIKYGNSRLTYTEVYTFLESLKISIFDKLESGLHTKVGINGDNLSGGQRQITLLLRCYFREAPVILMDEPLSAIDDKNIQEVIQIILKLTKDKTLIIISHNDKIQPVITREISVCE